MAVPVNSCGFASNASISLRLSGISESSARRSTSDVLATFTPIECGGHSVFLDQLVRRFTTEPTIDRRGQNSGGRKEGKVTAQLGLDDRREDPELIEHTERSLDQAIGGHERIGQHDPPHDGAAHVALVPLTSGQARRHREMTIDHELETVDPFSAPGVHLVRHRRGADLARAEALGRQLVTSHEAKRGGRTRRTDTACAIADTTSRSSERG